MKAAELRELETDDLQSRLRASRRELYELRFKLAVGQLEDHTQIRKARKEIARVLTLMHQRGDAAPAAADPATAEEQS